MIDELTEACNELRREGLDEKSIFKHIRGYADLNLRIEDFEKGLEWFNVEEALSTEKHIFGKIVVLDFFTYCCINCMHVLPDLAALENEFSIEDGLVVIGVHSAKFANERDSEKILAAVQRYNIGHPVVNDAKLSLWRGIGISCWPSLVLLGPEAQLLAVFVGEGHKEELFLYVKVALEYFKDSKRIKNHNLPLKLAQHLLPSSRKELLFPGKVETCVIDGTEKLVISDTGNNRILITNLDGKVCHVIGDYHSGFEDGNFHVARFNGPQGICILDRWIFVADNENHAIRKIDLLKSCVTTVAGNGTQGHDYIGGKRAKDQALSSPWDVDIYYHTSNQRPVPVLIIAVAGSHQIWALFLEDTVWWKKKEYKAGTCAAIVGNGREENRNNAYPHAASLAQPSGLIVAQELKVIYFADSESSTIRCVHLEDGRVSPVCGADKNPTNLHDFGDTDGSGYKAKLQHPLGVAWHPTEKNLYIADTYNHKIKKVDPIGNCVTLYGGFNEPSGLAIGDKGNSIYVADTNNHCIKVIRLKDNTVSSVVMEFQSKDDNDSLYEFDTEITDRGAELKIQIVIEFERDLKLNEEAPRGWRVEEKSKSLIVGNLKGDLGDPMVVQVLKGKECEVLKVVVDFVACNRTECLPKRFLVRFNILRKSGASGDVFQTKRLYVK